MPLGVYLGSSKKLQEQKVFSQSLKHVSEKNPVKLWKNSDEFLKQEFHVDHVLREKKHPALPAKLTRNVFIKQNGYTLTMPKGCSVDFIDTGSEYSIMFPKSTFLNLLDLNKRVGYPGYRYSLESLISLNRDSLPKNFPSLQQELVNDLEKLIHETVKKYPEVAAIILKESPDMINVLENLKINLKHKTGMCDFNEKVVQSAIKKLPFEDVLEPLRVMSILKFHLSIRGLMPLAQDRYQAFNKLRIALKEWTHQFQTTVNKTDVKRNVLFKHYRPTVKPFYRENKGLPDHRDISQGVIGNCIFLSALIGLSYSKPETLSKQIKNLGDGHYGFIFYRPNKSTDQMEKTMVVVDSNLPKMGLWYAGMGNKRSFTHGPTSWASLIEKAYTIFQGKNSYYYHSPTYPVKEYLHLAGKKSVIRDITMDLIENQVVFDRIKDALKNGECVSFLSCKKVKDFKNVWPGHAYSVLNTGYDEKTKENYLLVRNPWGDNRWFGAQVRAMHWAPTEFRLPVSNFRDVINYYWHTT